MAGVVHHHRIVRAHLRRQLVQHPEDRGLAGVLQHHGLVAQGLRQRAGHRPHVVHRIGQLGNAAVEVVVHPDQHGDLALDLRHRGTGHRAARRQVDLQVGRQRLHPRGCWRARGPCRRCGGRCRRSSRRRRRRSHRCGCRGHRRRCGDRRTLDDPGIRDVEPHTQRPHHQALPAGRLLRGRAAGGVGRCRVELQFAQRVAEHGLLVGITGGQHGRHGGAGQAVEIQRAEAAAAAVALHGRHGIERPAHAGRAAFGAGQHRGHRTQRDERVHRLLRGGQHDRRHRDRQRGGVGRRLREHVVLCRQAAAIHRIAAGFRLRGGRGLEQQLPLCGGGQRLAGHQAQHRAGQGRQRGATHHRLRVGQVAQGGRRDVGGGGGAAVGQQVVAGIQPAQACGAGRHQLGRAHIGVAEAGAAAGHRHLVARQHARQSPAGDGRRRAAVVHLAGSCHVGEVQRQRGHAQLQRGRVEAVAEDRRAVAGNHGVALRPLRGHQGLGFAGIAVGQFQVTHQHLAVTQAGQAKVQGCQVDTVGAVVRLGQHRLAGGLQPQQWRGGEQEAVARRHRRTAGRSAVLPEVGTQAAGPEELGLAVVGRIGQVHQPVAIGRLQHAATAQVDEAGHRRAAGLAGDAQCVVGGAGVQHRAIAEQQVVDRDLQAATGGQHRQRVQRRQVDVFQGALDGQGALAGRVATGL